MQSLSKPLYFTWLVALLGGLFIPHIVKANEKATTIQRIISLSPGTTELVASAGGFSKLVGVVSYSDYPLKAKKIPLVGNYNAINFEKIITLKPDLILVWQSGNRLQDIQRLQQLSKQLGYKIFYSNPTKISKIPQEIIRLGKLLHTQNKANSEAKLLKTILQNLKKTYQNRPPVRYFYQIWQQPLMTVNGQQFISQGLTLCAGQNIYTHLKPIAGEVSIESLIQRNPQVILLGGETALQQSWLKAWQKWPFIDAVKQHHIFKMNADVLQRPTARFIQALPKVCKALNQARPFKTDEY